MSIPKTTTWVNLAVKNYKDKNLMSGNFSDENVLKYQVKNIHSNDTCIKVSRLYPDFESAYSLFQEN